MQNIKKYFMTLALLLTAVTGAWAQTAFKVVEFKVPADWETDNNPVTAGDLPGFKASALAEAQAWTGAPSTGLANLIYAFDGNTIRLVLFSNGAPNVGGSTAEWTKKQVFGIKSSFKFYYTTEITEWSLTPDETGKTWTLAKMPASNVELQVEYEPTKVTMAVNDKTMGTLEVAGQSKVEWTADTWKGWTADIKKYTVDDITMTSSESEYAHIREYTSNNSLFFFVRKMVNDATVTFSTTGDPFSRIEFTMIGDYSQYNPDIIPNDNWTFEGKSAVWEGEATKSLTLQSCSTNVSKITFYKGAAIPDGVTINGDGTFTVAKTATVTLKATPAEGYKFLYWEDDQTNTNPVREVTIESGMADMTYKAVFAEPTFNVTFVEGTNLNEWTATPNTEVKKDTKVDIKYNGTKKVLGMTVAKAADNTYLKWDADQKKLVATEIPAAHTVTSVIGDVNYPAGTYVVEGNVEITGTITLDGDVDLIIKDGAKLTAEKINGKFYNLSIYGQTDQSGQLVVNSSSGAIMNITTLEVHSAKVTATSSNNDLGGFNLISIFNVYGGSVYAEHTGDNNGYGIRLYGGSMNIYGGDVTAVGKGNNIDLCYGITATSSSTVTVYGGKLWAENADNKALYNITLTIDKSLGFNGEIESSSDNSTWNQTVGTPDAKYVRVGY